MMIGPSFPAELEAAGLFGLPFAWCQDGTLVFGPEMTQAQIDAVNAVLAAHDPTRPAPPVVPEQVTRYQARYILDQQGLLAQVQAYFDALPETDMGKLAWNEAPSVRRDSDALISAAHSLNLTDEQIDEMFIAAAQVL